MSADDLISRQNTHLVQGLQEVYAENDRQDSHVNLPENTLVVLVSQSHGVTRFLDDCSSLVINGIVVLKGAALFDMVNFVVCHLNVAEVGGHLGAVENMYARRREDVQLLFIE